MDWARREFIPSAGPLQRYSRFLGKIQRVLLSRGVKSSIGWIRKVRYEYLRYLASPVGSPQEIRLAQRLRRVFGYRGAAVVLQKSSPVIRMVLTALTALRGFHLPAVVDTTSIRAPSTRTDLNSWVSRVPSFWKVLKKLRIVRSTSEPR